MDNKKHSAYVTVPLTAFDGHPSLRNIWGSAVEHCKPDVVFEDVVDYGENINLKSAERKTEKIHSVSSLIAQFDSESQWIAENKAAAFRTDIVLKLGNAEAYYLHLRTL